ncbi:peptidyl-prolyl cis-trans isomerase [Novimethylophilus kurashikiensis]|uniref:Peptidyl-prolyl cis-trans isomerase n=1 Tax=Novimethylophilus kurashikiensis TaxID=1825523 RepID=A0A2R5FD73_9PROT|nr:hypothetical protein [Novimethylophilus kurashikiensis]GBG14554.1 peptidyl-prolyl cis-trans isomerase [Novimethylophilus kurashikiensis]
MESKQRIAIYNYEKVLGCMVNGSSELALSEDGDREERDLLDEGLDVMSKAWPRRKAFMESRIEAGEEIDLDAEEADFFRKNADGKTIVEAQYVIDMIRTDRKMAKLAQTSSIFDVEGAKKLSELYAKYGIETVKDFKGLTLTGIAWSKKGAQKEKILLHATRPDGSPVCIRFEASFNLGFKLLHAVLGTDLRVGQTFDLTVEAVDGAIAKNKRAGKEVEKLGRFVNHNLELKANGKTQNGYPPKGVAFVQKPTIELMETLLQQVQMAIQAPDKKAA